jgi:hypothetical protein
MIVAAPACIAALNGNQRYNRSARVVKRTTEKVEKPSAAVTRKSKTMLRVINGTFVETPI